MVEGLIIVGMVAGFELLSARRGKRSSDGEDWTRHREHRSVIS